MTTFELYFCATLLRGALAVLFLLGEMGLALSVSRDTD